MAKSNMSISQSQQPSPSGSDLTQNLRRKDDQGLEVLKSPAASTAHSEYTSIAEMFERVVTGNPVVDEVFKRLANK